MPAALARSTKWAKPEVGPKRADGANIDSANHRTHVAFQDAEGNCPCGFKAIPQLVQRIVYDKAAPGGSVARSAIDTERALVDAADDLVGTTRPLVKQLVTSRRLVHLLRSYVWPGTRLFLLHRGGAFVAPKIRAFLDHLRAVLPLG